MTVISLKRILQLPAFCGPASLVCMLSQHGVTVEQKDIARSAEALRDIDRFGMRLDQLALAVRKLAPHLTVWAKRDASFEDLNTLINTYSLPVGVEWQGVWTEEQLRDGTTGVIDDDLGHWSVVTGISLDEKQLVIQDPDENYYLKPRDFSLEDFDKRWFDTNEVGADAPDEAKEWMNDYHVAFVIAPKSLNFPEQLGLKKVRIAVTYKKKSAIEKWFAKLWTKLTATAGQKTTHPVESTLPTVLAGSYGPLPGTQNT